MHGVNKSDSGLNLTLPPDAFTCWGCSCGVTWPGDVVLEQLWLLRAFKVMVNPRHWPEVSDFVARFLHVILAWQ